MLKLYPAQMSAFAASAREQFVRRMMAHLTRFFPREAAALGDSKLRALVEDGIEEARRYGITTRREVCKYLTLLLAFGRGFAEGAWARGVLEAPEIEDAKERVARLYEAAIAACERPVASGHDGG